MIGTGPQLKRMPPDDDGIDALDVLAILAGTVTLMGVVALVLYCC